MWYIYAMEYYSAVKKNKILLFPTTGMDFEGTMLSEINQTKTNTVCYQLYVESKKIQQTSEHNKTETDAQIQRTSGYQWGEGSREEQDRGRGLRSTNYYV